MRTLVIALTLLASLTGCGNPTGPGEVTEEQNRQGEEEMRKVEEEEQGTPVRARRRN